MSINNSQCMIVTHHSNPSFFSAASTSSKRKCVPVVDRRPSFDLQPEEKYQHDNEVLTLQVCKHEGMLLGGFFVIAFFLFSPVIIPSAVLLQLFSVGVHGFFPTQASQSYSRKESTNKGVNLRSVIRNASPTTKT